MTGYLSGVRHVAVYCLKLGVFTALSACGVHLYI